MNLAEQDTELHNKINDFYKTIGFARIALDRRVDLPGLKSSQIADEILARRKAFKTLEEFSKIPANERNLRSTHKVYNAYLKLKAVLDGNYRESKK